MSDWIDVSVRLHNGMPGWPGDRAFERHLENDMRRGDEYNLSVVSSSVHIGTHMDAPLHFVEGAASMEQAPLATLIGPARVIAIEDPREIPVAELERAEIRAGERVLFRTHNSDVDWVSRAFNRDFVAIPEDSARWLASREVSFIGIDYLSIGPFADGGPTHRAILGAGIWVVEGLDLSRTPPGDYDMICLPLKLEGAEGAPARVVLRNR